MSRHATAAPAARVPSSWVPVRATVLHRKCACGCHTAGGGECAACAARRKEQSRRAGTGHAAPAAVPPAVQSALAGPGQPLDGGLRTSMERGFGHDFSGVRVHSDAAAASSALAVDAHAYTVGEHIVFGAGRFAPHAPAGRRLLAHELTHVVQQGRGGGEPDVRTLSTPSDPSELEAEQAADRIASGRPAHVVQPPGAAVQGLSLGGGLAIGGGAIGLGLTIAALAGAFSGKKRKPQSDTCPATHTIPDDTHDAISTAWGLSGHGGDTVTEHGGRMVTTSAGGRAIRTGSGGGGSISLPAEQPGDVTTGTFHTHPYSKSEGATAGVSFSGGDIRNFIAGGQGSVKYIGAGTCNFALETRDTAARDACRAVDVQQRWDAGFAAASGSYQEKVETAVLAAIADCGLCFYRTCQPDARSPIPKAASLV